MQQSSDRDISDHHIHNITREMHLRRYLNKSFWRSFLPKSCSVGVLVAAITWLVILLIYFHSLRSSIVKAGWLPVPSTISSSQQQTAYQMNVAASVTESKIFDTFGIIRSLDDQHIRDIGYKRHAFNALVSNNIGVYREVPDTRHKVCRAEQYNVTELPKASIIMCFYNEHKMTLIRSLKTVLKRTPAQLLQEIILVDDCSDFDDLEQNLVEEVQTHLHYTQLRYVRNEQREGLIRSRVIGARMALGEVLIFLDSHIEVNRLWAEPLLQQVKRENASLAVPVIDIINADTFEYTASPLVRGGFNWGLHFKWENLPDGTLKNETDFKGPFRSPTMAGGLFAVNRQYFQYIGEYDMGMDIWGGENLEISFRIWQCGGAIKILPCSRVGHIFRKRRPYSSPDGKNTMLKNSLRLAYVWMDDYREHFLQHEKLHKNYEYGDITERQQLRANLQCKPFEWYLKIVYPELRIPGETRSKQLSAQAPPFQPWHSRKRNYIDSYMLRLAGTELCASVVAPKVKGFWRKRSALTLQPCNKTKNQIWYETEKSEIILDKLLCLEAEGTLPLINKCHEMLGDQQWRHTRAHRSPIYNMATGTCLRAAAAESGAGISLDLCSKHEASTWDIVAYIP